MKLFLLSIAFAIGAALPPALAQSPSDSELEALNDRALALHEAGKSGEAIPLAKQYVAGTKVRYGVNAPQYATALNNLAELLRATNRLAEAEPPYRRALAIWEKSLGPNHTQVALALNNLAQLLQDTNRLPEAEPLMRRALKINEANLGLDHPDVAIALNNLAQLLADTNRLAEAEPLMRRALKIDETSFGSDHPNVARDLNNLAQLLEHTNRLAEAEPLYRRVLKIDETSFGRDHPSVGIDLNNLAAFLYATNRLAEAEPLYRRVLQIDEASFGPDHPNVGRDLDNLAQLLQATSRLKDAEPLMRRALKINEAGFGPDHPKVALSLGILASLMQDTNQLDEAEPLLRRSLKIDEKSLGSDHPQVAIDLNNLGQLLKDTNRLADAEPLMRRALKIEEASFGPDHPNVARDLHNLAELLAQTSRLAEAEPLYRRALKIDEKSWGSDHPNVAFRLNGLAQLLRMTNRFAEAESLMRRVVAIFEKSLGPEHPNVATGLNNLAGLLRETNRAEAEQLHRRALAIDEASLGVYHPKVGTDLNNLAALLEDEDHWSAAVALRARAKPIMTGAHGDGERERGGLGKAVLAEDTGGLRAYARALYRADASDAANRAEGFELAQWALRNEAADALSAMSARFAKGGEQLAKLVREEQDLLRARKAAYRNLDAAAGKADAKAAEAARAGITKIEAKLREKQAQLGHDFPEYAELANPKPLSLADAQALLGEGQALVLFLDLPQYGQVPEETIVFAVTKNEARWVSIPTGRSALQKRVSVLRCGLDASNWRKGRKSREACKGLLGREAAADELPPFFAGMAHALYRDLFGGIEDLIKDKALLIVPSGPLTQLPFQVLVTKKPDENLPRFEAYKTAAWLGQRQAITILPSVGSLKALRTAKASAATEPFIGFGNPLLTGADGTDRSAWAKQDCGKAAPPKKTRVASVLESFASLFRGGAVDIDKLRQLEPLPEAADELCAVAGGLGVQGPELDKAVFLGKRATVKQVKDLSNSGELARARVVHFATHGLLAGQTAIFAKNKAEPALVLTPPDAGKESEEDNGLLTASEVAQLNLNADWVVMSACNTAAGSDEGAEALSGLARAFFYAGARSLLVSHWEVNSDAAVAITTGAVNEMKAEPKIGRAEALRRSIAKVMVKGVVTYPDGSSTDFSHPSVWAPFVLVGNGEQ
ncbi:MAG: tetratricopeptide repeat protein [Rhodomicrobium sp.]